MKPRLSLPLAALAVSHELSAWPHSGFSRDGRRVFGFRSDDDGVMPLFYRQRLCERIALQRVLATGPTKPARFGSGVHSSRIEP